MEIMGLHLPGATFVNPGTPLRDALTDAAVQRALAITARGDEPHADRPTSSTRRRSSTASSGCSPPAARPTTRMHLVAIAARGRHPHRLGRLRRTVRGRAAAGPRLPERQRRREPLPRRRRHGRSSSRELLDAGLLHGDVQHRARPRPAPLHASSRGSTTASCAWRDAARAVAATRRAAPGRASRSAADGGLRLLQGNLGRAVIKVSAVEPRASRDRARRRVVFDDQEALHGAFKAGELDRDFVAVVRYQGPRANGMPELHKLTPIAGRAAGPRLQASRWSPTAACRAPPARCRRRSTSRPRPPTAARSPGCATATSCRSTARPARWKCRCRPTSCATRPAPTAARPGTTAAPAGNCSAFSRHAGAAEPAPARCSAMTAAR